MPSKEWNAEHPKVSAYLSKEIHDKLKTFMAKTRIKSASQAIEIILNEFLSSSQKAISDNDTENRLRAIEKEVIAIKEQLNKNKVGHSSLPKKEFVDKSSTKVAQSSLTLSLDRSLTTGEAYIEAKRRGYSKTVGTFRRSLRDRVVPNELERIGLKADWDIRSQANPKDNSVKWLRFIFENNKMMH
jgi:hypothetical protein